MTKLIQGKKSIMNAFLLSETRFYMFVKLNMPVRLINKRWYGYHDNIEAFFRKEMVSQPAIEINGDIQAIKDKEK